MKEVTYEDLLERNKLQISELNTLTEEYKMLKPEQVYDGCVKGWI